MRILLLSAIAAATLSGCATKYPPIAVFEPEVIECTGEDCAG
ncbi:hypothetical protein [Halocynthiibacter sp.]